MNKHIEKLATLWDLIPAEKQKQIILEAEKILDKPQPSQQFEPGHSLAIDPLTL